VPEPTVGLVAVDATELVLDCRPTGATDVIFDGRRILSIGPRDLRPRPEGVGYAWPLALRRHLTGQTRLALRDHVSGDLLLEAEVTFDATTARTRVVDSRGRPLAIDKAGQLGPMFETADAEAVRGLLGIAQRLIGDIEAFGGVGFIAFGTLLGAVRNGKLIGHDNDVDLIFFSRAHEPAGLIRESLALERFLQARGWVVDRPRASFIRVEVPNAGLASGYMDIFGAFHDGSRMYLDRFAWPEIPVEAIVPVSTVTLEGLEMSAPGDPEQVLASIYGADFRVPDPSFKHRPPREVTRAAGAWFGNHRRHRSGWNNWLTLLHPEPPPVSVLAHHVADRARPGATVVDLGCGHGQDALWLARQGLHVVAVDYLPAAVRALSRAAAKERLAVEVNRLSFHSIRHAIAHGALLATRPAPEDGWLMAHDLLDVLDEEGRENVWAFARAALLPGGRLLVALRDDPLAADPDQPRVIAPTSDEVLAEAVRCGLRVERSAHIEGRTVAELVAVPGPPPRNTGARARAATVS